MKEPSFEGFFSVLAMTGWSNLQSVGTPIVADEKASQPSSVFRLLSSVSLYLPAFLGITTNLK